MFYKTVAALITRRVNRIRFASVVREYVNKWWCIDGFCLCRYFVIELFVSLMLNLQKLNFMETFMLNENISRTNKFPLTLHNNKVIYV